MMSEGRGRIIMSLKINIKVLDVLCLLCLLLHAYQVTGIVTSISIVGPTFADEGTNVDLKCDARCNNGSCTSYSWSTDGLQPSSASTRDVKLTNVQRKESGAYSITCKARDEDNVYKTSGKHLLDVYYGPDSVTISPSSLTIQEKKTYPEIKCEGVSCSPGCEYKWTRGGTTVSTSAVLKSTTDIVKRTEAGEYTCTATNTKKTATKTKTFILTVQYPPDVTVSWISASNTLQCQASGIPDSYTFKAFTQTVDRVSVRQFTGTASGKVLSHKFTSLTYMDRGKYTCTVSNGITPIGASDSWISGFTSFTPDDKPKLLRYQDTYNVSKGASLAIVLELYAHPALSPTGVTLRDNSSYIIEAADIFDKTVAVTTEFYGVDVSLSDGQKVTAVFQSVEESYFGNLNITMGNGNGTAACDITLFPEGPPDPPIDVKVGERSHDAVTLTFRSGFFNGADQTFVAEYKAGDQWLNGSDVFAGVEKNLSFSITISGLEPETFYEFQLYGYNIYDRSNYTDAPVNVTTLEAPPQVGAIVGATLGGVAAVAIVIVVAILIWRWRRRRADDKQSIQRESASSNEYKPAPKKKPSPLEGKENNLYMRDEPAYENTKLGNGVPSKQQKGLDSGKSIVEPIYSNQPSDRVPSKQQKGLYSGKSIVEPMYSNQPSDSVTAGYGEPHDHTDTGEHLIAQEGYLDLARKDSVVEEAYITKGASKSATPAASTEEEYINMDTVKDLPKPKPHNPGSKSHYLNVSQHIGLIGTEADKQKQEESNYLDMDVTQTSKMDAKLSGHKTSSAAAVTSTEGTYVAMSPKGGPPAVATKPKTDKQRIHSPYMNVTNPVSKNPSGKSGQSSVASSAPELRSRNSIPSYHAPAPPPADQAFQEENYENVKLR